MIHVTLVVDVINSGRLSEGRSFAFSCRLPVVPQPDWRIRVRDIEFRVSTIFLKPNDATTYVRLVRVNRGGAKPYQEAIQRLEALGFVSWDDSTDTL